MNILDLDSSNDRRTFNRLFEILNEHSKGDQVRETIDELEMLVHGYLNKYHDLKYAMEQALTVTVTDVEGRIIYADDQFCALSQYNRKELIGRTHRLLKTDHHPPAFYKSLWSEILNGNVWNGEICNQKKTGEIFWVNTTIVPLLTTERNPHSFIAFYSEIITVHPEAELLINHMAYHDPLTDLPNRRKVQEDLEAKIFRVRKQEAPLTIFLCDLDRFKYVNDALGHTTGDEVIQLMGHRIWEAAKGSGELYRLGGDEFFIISDKITSKKEARELGNNILEQISKPIRLNGKEFFITSSIGVAQYSGGSMSAGKMIGNADIAMHYCKLNGRQSLRFYNPSMNAYYNELVSLEGDLREAISKKELMLYYQPKIDVRSGVISGMEALVRWNHPEKGFISPAKFIPIAEETGLIIRLGEWVLYEACRQNQEWIEQGYAPERVAVNVAAEEIQRHDFAGRVQTVLEKTGMPAEFLEIEITENSIMQNTEACIRTMQELRRLGIALSIDDFGTGYSSLGYLRKFPINYLKIDQSFIKGIGTDPGDAEIVKAMIQLGHTFKLEVVGEGVEKPAILEFLEHNGCDHYQGYHFSKPLPPAEFESLLTKRNTYSYKRIK
ncbi:putative bifunctional diguanylate cyclase/phosphodiesterase [Thalassobacillus devorans]|uniref:putative bifunctional diguanylate cyclase/phosphodiesterase n=1 Tax=Thalassobacillus devorans TaxID=279813 RepID=UPI0004B0793A|nr:EAL domain-containing protein [Thalassobacillus devorans]